MALRNILIATVALVCFLSLVEAYSFRHQARNFRGRVRRFFSPDREFEFAGETIVVSKMAVFHAQKIRKLSAFNQCSKEISDEEKNSVDSAFFHNVISNGYESIRNYLRNLKEQIHERILLIRKVLDCVHDKPIVVIGRVKSSQAQAVLVLHPNMTISAAYVLDSHSSLRALTQRLPHPAMDIAFQEYDDDLAEGSESVFQEEEELSNESEEVEFDEQSDDDSDDAADADFQEEEFENETDDVEFDEQSDDEGDDDDNADADFQEEEFDNETDDVEFDEQSDDDADDDDSVDADFQEDDADDDADNDNADSEFQEEELDNEDEDF